jgi:hypothetical protein
VGEPTEKKTPQKVVLENGSYTPIPHWFIEDVLRCAPPYVSRVWLTLLRKTVGWGKWIHESQLDRFAEEVEIRPQNVSRALHMLNAGEMIVYRRGSRGAMSQFEIKPEPLVDKFTVRIFLSAMHDTLKEEEQLPPKRSVAPETAYHDYDIRPDYFSCKQLSEGIRLNLRKWREKDAELERKRAALAQAIPNGNRREST